MKEQILDLIKYLDIRITNLEDYIDKHSDEPNTSNKFAEGRASAFHEIRSKLYGIL